MKNNVWQELPKPFLVQAPMEHVTDTVFRQIIAQAGSPDLYFTEFTSVEGLDSKGAEEVKKRLVFTEVETPLIAQVWGKTPEKYFKAAQKIVHMGFNGIDINMGCPDRTVMKNGCCAALINNPSLAAEIIQAVKEGVSGSIPVSVKTRIGTNKIVTEDWIAFLIQQDIAALTVHGRTAKEQSLVPAHWDEIGKAVAIRNKMKTDTPIIGNGDIESYQQAMDMVNTYGVDGVMIGRGIFHNLWVFNKEVNKEQISKELKLKFLIDHIMLYDQVYGSTRDFNIMKKFYKIYINGWPNASELRIKLMEFDNAIDTLTYLKSLKMSSNHMSL